MRLPILLYLVLIGFPSLSWAGGAGTTGAQFLKIGMGARAVGMGGAFSAMADDATAVYWNPAGLAGSESSELSLGFTRYFQDVKLGHLAYSGNLERGRFGVGATYLNVPDIERRTNDAVGIVPVEGTFSANDLAVSLAYAKKNGFPSLLDNLDVGVAAKLIRSTIDSESAVAVALDVGAIYRATGKMNVAFVIQNAGTSMKFKEEGDPLPLCLKVAVSYKPGKLLNLGAELNEYLLDQKFYAALGGEYWLRDAFALRAGYRFGYDTSNLGAIAGMSLGVGIKVQALGLDYAFLPFGDLGDTHRMGFWIKF